MNNGQKNEAFLAAITAQAKALILASIAKHYGIDSAAAYAEVTDSEAEHLLDYMTNGERTAAHVLMQKHRMI